MRSLFLVIGLHPVDSAFVTAMCSTVNGGATYWRS